MPSRPERKKRSGGVETQTARLLAGCLTNPGNDLLSRGKHYHRPRMLNGRVRNGNGCGHPGVVAGKRHGVATGSGRWLRGPARPVAEKGINAAKRSAVSTGPLRRLPAVHARPIDLVVFQEPSPT